MPKDAGLSAFDGSNITRGKLGRFLDDVQAGRIPRGSSLIVESLDRLSRQGIIESTDIALLATCQVSG
jgi:DNA invertase Pin-like site-specific DNA recombinase